METAPQQEPKPEKPKGNGKDHPVLMPDRFGEAEFKTHHFIADAEVGTTIEQVMDPAYWAHVAQQMDPFDHIEVRAEDGSWIAYLIVKACERNYAKVVLDRVVKLEGDMEIPASSMKHKVEWKGPHHKHCVIRISDSQMVSSGHKSRFEAETWMRNHERGMEK